MDKRKKGLLALGAGVLATATALVGNLLNREKPGEELEPAAEKAPAAKDMPPLKYTAGAAPKIQVLEVYNNNLLPALDKKLPAVSAPTSFQDVIKRTSPPNLSNDVKVLLESRGMNQDELEQRTEKDAKLKELVEKLMDIKRGEMDPAWRETEESRKQQDRMIMGDIGIRFTTFSIPDRNQSTYNIEFTLRRKNQPDVISWYTKESHLTNGKVDYERTTIFNGRENSPELTVRESNKVNDFEIRSSTHQIRASQHSGPQLISDALGRSGGARGFSR